MLMHVNLSARQYDKRNTYLGGVVFRIIQAAVKKV